MRATPTNSSSHLAPQASETPVRSLDPVEDALVMVLFPRVSWDAVCALAADLGVEPAEALGAALALLRKQVDAAKV